LFSFDGRQPGRVRQGNLLFESFMKPTLLFLGTTLVLSFAQSLASTADAIVPLKRIRREVIIKRTASLWESQQVQEPCILPNPKDPARQIMFYSGVPATNRGVCFTKRGQPLMALS
jgi:hypothetical protein